MDDITRRTFLKSAVGASAMLAGCSSNGGDPDRIEDVRDSAADRVELGRSGVLVPRVAMGTGTHGWKRASDQTRLGQQDFSKLMAHGVERGAAFIDAADLYGSHSFVRSALEDGSVKRDDVTILSKIWFGEAPEMTPTTTALPEVERFRGELGVDVIDICLIHCTQDALWPEQLKQMRDELSELKSRGVVRAVGCSCHTNAALKVAAEHPWVDVVLGRINPEKQVMDGDATVDETAATLRLARANGKGVLGMKIFGCGAITSAEAREASLRYSFGGDLIDAATIGFTSPEQIDDAMDTIDSVLTA